MLALLVGRTADWISEMSDAEAKRRSCATCRYRDGDDDGLDRCRRYAPRALVTWEDRPDHNDSEVSERDYRHFPVWPVVWPHEWCGEWTGKLQEHSGLAPLPLLPQLPDPLPESRWRHWKGDFYRVICTARLEEDKTTAVVVYQSERKGYRWVRTLDDWHKEISPGQRRFVQVT